jgi:hypothetical protein
LDFPPFWDVEMDQDDDLDIEVFPPEFGGKSFSAGLRALHRIQHCVDYGYSFEPYKGWSAVKFEENGAGDIEKEHGKKYAGISAHKLIKGAHKLIKGDHEVWYVNESQYSNVGYESPAFFAFDEVSIKALQKDIGGHLETDTTVMSSW